MKTIQKILIVVSLIVIIVGLLILWKNGLLNAMPLSD